MDCIVEFCHRRSGYIAHNLDDVFGVGIAVTGQRAVLILYEIVASSQAGDDILAIGDGVGGTGSGGQIGSDRLGKRFGIVLGFQRFRLCGSVTQRGLARFADAGAPDDVGQDLGSVFLNQIAAASISVSPPMVNIPIPLPPVSGSTG